MAITTQRYPSTYVRIASRMFDSLDIPSGTKIAVTTSTISDASYYLLSNYNGPGPRHRDRSIATILDLLIRNLYYFLFSD